MGNTCTLVEEDQLTTEEIMRMQQEKLIDKVAEFGFSRFINDQFFSTYQCEKEELFSLDSPNQKVKMNDSESFKRAIGVKSQDLKAIKGSENQIHWVSQANISAFDIQELIKWYGKQERILHINTGMQNDTSHHIITDLKSSKHPDDYDEQLEVFIRIGSLSIHPVSKYSPAIYPPEVDVLDAWSNSQKYAQKRFSQEHDAPIQKVIIEKKEEKVIKQEEWVQQVEVIEELRKKVQEQPDNKMIYSEYREQLLSNDNKKGVVSVYQEEILVMDKGYDIYEEYINFLKQNFPQYQKLLLEAMFLASSHPESKGSFNIQILKAIDDCDSGELIRNYTKQSKTNPKDYLPLFFRGEVYLFLALFDTALESFQSALKLKPNMQLIQYKICQSQFGLRDYEQALLYLEQIPDKSKNKHAIKLQADIDFALEYYESARRLYEQALDIDKEFCDALLGYGDCLQQLGFISQALKNYDLIISLDPDYLLARFKKAQRYVQSHQYSEGLNECKEIIKRSPNYIVAMQLQITCHEGLNQWELAKKCQKQVDEYFGHSTNKYQKYVASQNDLLLAKQSLEKKLNAFKLNGTYSREYDLNSDSVHLVDNIFMRACAISEENLDAINDFLKIVNNIHTATIGNYDETFHNAYNSVDPPSQCYSELFEILKAKKQLNSLTISFNSKKCSELKSLEAVSEGLSKLSKLTTLNLSLIKNDITNAKLQNVMEKLVKLTNLTELSLNFGHATLLRSSYSQLGEYLIKFKKLTKLSLDLSDNKESEGNGVMVLDSLPQLTNLKELSLKLANTKMSSENIKFMRRKVPMMSNNLRSLELWIRENKLDDEDFKVFCEIPWFMPNLTSLSMNFYDCQLSGNGISQFLEHISKLPLTELTLSFSKNKFSNDIIMEICQGISKQKNLTTLKFYLNNVCEFFDHLKVLADNVGQLTKLENFDLQVSQDSPQLQSNRDYIYDKLRHIVDLNIHT